MGTFRALSTGLEPIPENDVTEMSMVFQPLVPPAVPKPPATTSYNIRLEPSKSWPRCNAAYLNTYLLIHPNQLPDDAPIAAGRHQAGLLEVPSDGGNISLA